MRTRSAVVVALLVSASAAGIEEAWHFDTPCAAPSLPLVADYNNDGVLDVVVLSPQDASIRMFDAKGKPVHRMTSPHHAVGSASSDGAPGHVAFEEVNGCLTALDYRVQGVFRVDTGAQPVPGYGPCIADLDGDAVPEVLCARPNGLLYAFSPTLVPRWQFDAGEPLRSAVAVAPVFGNVAGVYAVAGDGSLCAIAGNGQPLWRFVPGSATVPHAGQDGPLVVQFPYRRPTVLFSGSTGWLYAVDAGNGSEQWRARVSDADLGAPAIADVMPSSGLEIVVVSERGDIVVLDEEGRELFRGALPKETYVARPLVADVDADGKVEVLVAGATSWTILVASLSGEPKQTLNLCGNASEGCVLADLDEDGFLELLVATDCARVHCFETLAKSGWTHPRASYACNGCVAPVSPLPLPEVPVGDRGARVDLVSIRDYIEKDPFASAFVSPRLYRGARYLVAAVRKEDRILGSAWKRITPEGTTVPFVHELPLYASLDVSLYREEDHLIASSSGIPLRSSTVKLVDIPSVETFLAEIDRIAKRCRHAVPPELPVVAGRSAWHFCDLSPEQYACLSLEPFVSEAIPYAWRMMDTPPLPEKETMAVIGGDNCCAALAVALVRGAARQRGTAGPPGTGAWGVRISDEFGGARTDRQFLGERPRVQWLPPNLAQGPDCGHSTSLQSRLLTASHLAGATYVYHESGTRNGSIFVQEDPPGQFSISPVGLAMKTWHELANSRAERGIPYAPFAFMLEDGHLWDPRENFGCREPNSASERSARAMFAHVFGCEGHRGLEQDCLTYGPYGDVFDVITESAELAFLAKYGVVWALGDITFHDAQVRRLMRYVEKGGILVLDAPRAEAFPSSFTGVALSGERAVATQVQTALGPTGPVSAPLRYRIMAPSGRTEILAWTDAGNPLLTWRKFDEGLVIVGATDRWVDERGHLLPVVPVFVNTLADAFVPVEVSCDVQLSINRTTQGWVVGLINNHGVTKSPTTPPVIDETQIADCLLYFKEGVPLRFMPRMGEFNWSNKANGLQTRIKPGEAAIVEAIFGPQAAAAP